MYGFQDSYVCLGDRHGPPDGGRWSLDNSLAKAQERSGGLGCTPVVRQKVKSMVGRVEKSSCLRLIVLSQSAAVG